MSDEQLHRECSLRGIQWEDDFFDDPTKEEFDDDEEDDDEVRRVCSIESFGGYKSYDCSETN